MANLRINRRAVSIKNKEEIKIMREGGRKLAEVMTIIKKAVRPGLKTGELDKMAEAMIKKAGGRPSFKMVKGYNFATCLCVNDCVVHGIPDNYSLKEGDILGIDLGILYQGFHTDMAETVRVINEKPSNRPSARAQVESAQAESLKVKSDEDEIDKFLKTGRKALDRAIKAAVIGNYLGNISQAIEETIETAGYSVVKELVGHGVGRELHEEPAIPGFLKGKIEKTLKLSEGMVLAIEVIYNQGKPEIVYKNNDGWTLVTADKKLSGLFERTIAITLNEPLILTN